MNTELRTYAGSLQNQADQIRGQNDFELIKAAALKSLKEKGYSEEVVEPLLKQAEAAIPSTAAENLKHADFLEKQANLMLQAAGVIEDLDSKLTVANAEIANMVKEASVGSELNYLQQTTNLTAGEMDALKSLPEEMITKLASTHTPELGRPGRRSSDVDGLTAFVLDY